MRMAFFGNSVKHISVLNSWCNQTRCRFKSIHSKISEIFSAPPSNTPAVIKGWVKSVRKMKGMIFLDVNDGSTCHKLQIVASKTTVPKNLSYGCSIVACGPVILNPQNQLELRAEELSVVGSCDLTNGYPFLPRKSYDAEYVRQYLHLRPRTNSFSSLLRLRHHASWTLRQYLNMNGYIEVHTPVLTSNDCEGAGETFFVKPNCKATLEAMASPGQSEDEVFFKRKAYLSVSGQLQLEIMARSLSNVYSFGPIFRAENSKSRLHLSEFYMLEVEKAFLDSMNELLEIMEKLLKSVLSTVFENHREEIEHYRKMVNCADYTDVENIISKPFQVLTFDEAKQILRDHSGQFQEPLLEKEGFTKEHELFLVKLNNNVPVFIVEWPAHMKPFYMKASTHSPEKVLAVDLLCPVVGELCGGSLREDDCSILEERMQKLNLTESLDWYLDIRKYGNVPSGGFGLGFERFLQMALGVSNIKDAIPFPRWPKNCKF
nr:PREDICTED: probable asparagine--tRNA ligase, mitochondrial isoform X1 [Bemisia tabaci]